MTAPYGFGGSSMSGKGKKDRVRDITPVDSAGVEDRYKKARSEVKTQQRDTDRAVVDAQRGRSGFGGRNVPDDEKIKKANDSIESLGRSVERAASLQDSVKAVRRPKR